MRFAGGREKKCSQLHIEIAKMMPPFIRLLPFCVLFQVFLVLIMPCKYFSSISMFYHCSLFDIMLTYGVTICSFMAALERYGSAAMTHSTHPRRVLLSRTSWNASSVASTAAVHDMHVLRQRTAKGQLITPSLLKKKDRAYRGQLPKPVINEILC